jgi:hypothetical protein
MQPKWGLFKIFGDPCVPKFHFFENQSQSGLDWEKRILFLPQVRVSFPSPLLSMHADCFKVPRPMVFKMPQKKGTSSQ